MPSEKDFKTLAGSAFKVPPAAVRVEPLAGDASYRLYFRLHVPAGAKVKTAVLMQMRPLGQNSQAEEISKEKAPAELPFINIQRFLMKSRLVVPGIYAYDEEKLLLLLEDVGEESLYDRLQKIGEICAAEGSLSQNFPFQITADDIVDTVSTTLLGETPWYATV